ncbi:MAG: helix-turn-helix domain-containing protein [Vicinamibacterales bacterium]
MVTVEEAGRALRVSRSTVWRLIQRGELPSVRRGGRRLVPSTAVRTRARRRRTARMPAFSHDHPIFVSSPPVAAETERLAPATSTPSSTGDPLCLPCEVLRQERSGRRPGHGAPSMPGREGALPHERGRELHLGIRSRERQRFHDEAVPVKDRQVLQTP